MPTWHDRYIGRRKGVQTRWKRRRTADREREREREERRGEEKQRKKGAFLRPSSASRRNLILDWISALCRSRETLLRSSSRRFDPDSRYIDDPVSHLLFPSPRNLFVLSIYHRHCEARGGALHTVDFIRSFCAALRRYRDSVAYYNEDL